MKIKNRPPNNSLGAIVLVLFVVLLVAVIVLAAFRRSSLSTAALPTALSLPTDTSTPTRNVSQATATSQSAAQGSTMVVPSTPGTSPATLNANDKLPPDAQIIASTVDHDIQVSSDGITFQSTGLKGSTPMVSSDGQAIVYAQGTAVLFYQGHNTTTASVMGMVAWSDMVMSNDGSLLILSGYDDQSNRVFVTRKRFYWSSDQDEGVIMLMLSNSKAPVILDPDSKRLIVAQNNDDHTTAIYSIETNCLADECDKSRQDIAKVPYIVNWMSYQPGGKAIAFSEDGGNIYLLAPATKQVSPLIVDSTKKIRPVFNSDGTKLLYLDPSRKVNIFRLSDQKVISSGGLKVVSASWVTPIQKAAATPVSSATRQVMQAKISSVVGKNSDGSLVGYGQIVVVAEDGTILTSIDGTTFSPVGLKGSFAIPSPDGKTLLYAPGPQLQLHQGATDTPIRLNGPGGEFSWSLDGKKLYQILNGSGFMPTTGRPTLNGTLWGLELGDAPSQAMPITYGQRPRLLIGPAAEDPQTNRLILAQITGYRQTSLISVNADCENLSKCFDDATEIASIPYTVNWIDRAHDGSSIVLGDDDGNIHLLNLATNKISDLVVDKTYKMHPVFSPDDKQIAFIDQDRRLNIFNLADKSTRVVEGLRIKSVYWQPMSNELAAQEGGPPSPVVNASSDSNGTGSYVLPDDVQLIVSTNDHDILVSRDLKSFERTGLKGNDVVAAPDRKTLAYFRDSYMWIYENGAEQHFNLSGTGMRTPAWSPDERMIIFSASGDYTEIMRSGVGSHLLENASPIFQLPGIVAPPIFDPLTGRLALAKVLGPRQTEFSIIEPWNLDCNCDQSERIAVVPYDVTWMSYQPDGSAIAFSEKDGNIYLLTLSTGKITPLKVDTKHKSRPSFSQDGTRLAYIDEVRQLYIMNLQDSSVQAVLGLKIQSAAWLR